jgi:hypothetical protein
MGIMKDDVRVMLRMVRLPFSSRPGRAGILWREDRAGPDGGRGESMPQPKVEALLPHRRGVQTG